MSGYRVTQVGDIYEHSKYGVAMVIALSESKMKAHLGNGIVINCLNLENPENGWRLVSKP